MSDNTPAQTTGRLIRSTVVAAIAVVSAMGTGLRAQAPRPTFDVVSIKPCKADPNFPPGAPGDPSGEYSSPGRLRIACRSLVGVINDAYIGYADGRLKSESIPLEGGPAWLDSDFYEITATAAGAPSVGMMLGPMMQVLLEDRFQLKVHFQAKEGAVYFLSAARGGPKLQPFTEGTCVPYSTPLPKLQPGQEVCRYLISVRSTAGMQAQGATLDAFSKLLRGVLGRPVINKTGITGRFDIRVQFSREGTRLADIRPVGPAPINVPPAASDPTGQPSIFTALQEQLGLRLESGRGPVEMLVIDSIEKPREN